MAIAWQDWGPEAFERARREDKPLLLRITGTWCHWCHVMDHTSDQDPEAQRLIAASFVPVRVDTDRLPDVNERYNMGGWPTTAFLTPDGDVLYGETYIPPARFVELLGEIARVHRERRGDVRRHVEEHARRLLEAQRLAEKPAYDAAAAVEQVSDAVLANFDAENGGFGTAPKFPHPDALEFCLLGAEVAARDDLRTVARRTLEKMAAGEVWDREELGFFRYATRPDWGLPHYEKMLEVNAELLAVYARASLLAGEPRFREAAEGIVAYLRERLRRAEGVYGHSQDADEEYYALPLAKRRQRAAPRVDATVCTNYNAALASALLRAAPALERWDLVAEGEGILRWLRERAWDTSRGLHHYWDGTPHVLNLLDDHARLLRALVDAYEATGQRGYLRWFDDLAKQTERFLGTEAGAFRDRPPDPNALGRLREERKPLAPNGVLAQAFLRYAHLTGDERYRRAARAILADLAPGLGAFGIFGSEMAAAALLDAHEPLLLTVIGTKDGAAARATEELHRAALRVPRAARAVEVLRRGEHDAALKARGYGSVEPPALLACFGRTCAAPVREARDVPRAVEAFVASRPASRL